MKRFKQWLYNRFLPAWCKDDLMSVNQRLSKVIVEQRAEIDRLNAYIEGFETAARLQRRITINTGGVRK